MGEIRLERWAEQDAGLLVELNGDAEQMQYLGGPETPERLADRQQRFLAGEWCYCIVDADGRRSGWVGFWESEWNDDVIFEMGWSVRKDLHGRGLATAGTRLAIEEARRAARDHDGVTRLHAFPGTANIASNKVCERAGFTLAAEDLELEYPPGQAMRANDWSLALV